MSEHSSPSIVDSIRHSLGAFNQADIALLETEMLKHEQADCPVIHRFSPGIYMRELHMKAGTFAIGHFQKTEHLNLFLKGSVITFNEDGTSTELVAPMCFVSPQGRKVGLVTADMVWINIYATEETNIEKLEAMFLDKSENFKESPLIKNMEEALQDQVDFLCAIEELGFSIHSVYAQSFNPNDQIPMPHGAYKFQTAPSHRHGTGLFATADIVEGELIGAALIDEMRTPIGRYANHSKNPNSKMVFTEFGNAFLSAIKNINGSKGGGVGEEITVDYRQVIHEKNRFSKG